MMQNQITHLAGAHKRRKRVGRGESSGLGRTSTRGNKGAQSRAGCSINPLKEGGQMPLFRRLPKRGFSNFHFRREYQVVNLLDLEAAFENGATVDAQTLRALGGMPGDAPIKVLAEGELTKKLAVEVHAISAKAKAAIEKIGGTVKLLAQRDSAALAKAKRNTKKKERLAKRETGKNAG
jgi:large subunit ribosomal protein L15